MKPIIYFNEIKELLEQYPESRDSDIGLYFLLFQKLGYYHTMSVYEFFKKMKAEEIPNFESVSRTRRKLQENNISLRGTLWESRQEYAKQTALELKS